MRKPNNEKWETSVGKCRESLLCCLVNGRNSVPNIIRLSGKNESTW